jgi:hypothetical protein
VWTLIHTQPRHASKSIKQRTRLRLMLIHRHRTTRPTHIDTSRDTSNVQDSFLVDTNRPRYNTIARLVTHTLIPTVTQMTCAHALIYPRMENLSLPDEPNRTVSGYVDYSSLSTSEVSLSRSEVSPSQNNNACSCVQVCWYPQCLLSMLAGLMAPGMWIKGNVLAAIDSRT